MSVDICKDICNQIENYGALPLKPVEIVGEWRNDENAKTPKVIRRIAAVPVFAIYAPIAGAIVAISNIALNIFSKMLGKDEIAQKFFNKGMDAIAITLLVPTVGLFQNLFCDQIFPS